MKGVGSKSMDTKVYFTRQTSDSILRLILPKNFYDLRYVIPQTAAGIKIFSEMISPPDIHKNILFICTNYFPNTLPCIAHYNE
jgi:hypothetical protein